MHLQMEYYQQIKAILQKATILLYILDLLPTAVVVMLVVMAAHRTGDSGYSPTPTRPAVPFTNPAERLSAAAKCGIARSEP